MINWTDIENKLYTWVSQISEINVIWANQNAPQPEAPYITLNIISINKVGGFDDLRYENGNFNRCGLRRITLSIQVYGKEGLTILTKLKDSLETFNVEQLLKEDTQIGIMDATDINDTTIFLDTIYEVRYSMDVMFYIPNNVEITDMPSIDRVHITGELEEGKTGTKTIDTEISV